MVVGRNHIVGYWMCRTKSTWRVHENFEVQRLDQSNIAILTEIKHHQSTITSKFIKSVGHILYTTTAFRQFRLFLMLLYSCTYTVFSHDLQQKNIVRDGQFECYRYCSSLNSFSFCSYIYCL